MKKLLVLSSFIVFGFVAVNAQNAKPVSTGNNTTLMEQPSASVKVEAKEVDKKKEHCTDADKKQCGTKSGSKSCCAHKTEAKKEDAK